MLFRSDAHLEDAAQQGLAGTVVPEVIQIDGIAAVMQQSDNHHGSHCIAKRIAIKTLDTIIDELEEINRLLLSFCKNEKRKEKQ